MEDKLRKTVLGDLVLPWILQILDAIQKSLDNLNGRYGKV